MPTAEHAAPGPSAPRAPAARRAGGRRTAWATLALILAGGLALRLWGYAEGLPFIYNIDEADHFVPRAVEMFAQGTLNPRYFENPPAFTYLLHAIYWVAYGGASGVGRHFALHPAAFYEIARVTSALLGTLAIWLLYLTGARLFGRAAGLLAAALEAVAFLPVAYSHLALNDVPTLAPLTASLLGSAGILRRGRARDWALAGVGLGLACATKYTAGIALVALLGAGAWRWRESAGRAGRALGGGLLLAGALALVTFILANPYSVLDFSEFHSALAHQSAVSAEAQGKLGAPKEPAILYYLWSLTWGLGWLPALAALGGALVIWRRERGAWLMLVPASLLFLAFMGGEGRFFGRWLMPLMPFACLLAAGFARETARGVSALVASRVTGRARAAALGCAGAVAVALLLAQGLLYSAHADLVLSRPDTRQLAREWMLAHVPRGSPIVSEPVSLPEWDQAAGPGGQQGTGARIWNKYPSLLPRVNAAGVLQARTGTQLDIEDYERTLAPALLGYYKAHGYCWVLTGSTQSGRAFADPRAVPHAIAYYHALARSGEVVFRASPYAREAHPVAFNFDWSFDYYPLAYERPGPLMTLYRLHGGRCGAAARP